MTQIRQLFGTDGIRGVAGEFPLTKDSTYVIGRALGHDLKRSNPNAKVVIGQDTRESSAWIADQVSAGLLSVGVAVKSAGVITTPGIAYLARSRNLMLALSFRRRTIRGPITELRSFRAPAINFRIRTNSRLKKKSLDFGRTAPRDRKSYWFGGAERTRRSRSAACLHSLVGRMYSNSVGKRTSTCRLRERRGCRRGSCIIPSQRCAGDVSARHAGREKYQ